MTPAIIPSIPLFDTSIILSIASFKRFGSAFSFSSFSLSFLLLMDCCSREVAHAWISFIRRERGGTRGRVDNKEKAEGELESEVEVEEEEEEEEDKEAEEEDNKEDEGINEDK